MSRGQSNASQRAARSLGTALLSLGNVACGILYYIVAFHQVIDNVSTHTMETHIHSTGEPVSSVFMVCFLGLVIGTVQVATIHNNRHRSNHNNGNNNVQSYTTQLSLCWLLATIAGYFAWALIVKGSFNLFAPMVSSLESYSVLATDKIFSICLIVVIQGVIIPGLTIGFAQYLAMPHKSAKATQWPLVHTSGLFLAVAVPVIIPALVAYVIAAANPGAYGSVIVFTMFIGLPVWLLLASVLGCLSLQFTNRWLANNVFPSKRAYQTRRS